MTPVPSSKLTVAVLGGGVGGLSAAHEMAERGYAVTVYERHFPGFYKHVTDTRRRIPFGPGGASCVDNLVLATRMLLARAGRGDPTWVTSSSAVSF